MNLILDPNKTYKKQLWTVFDDTEELSLMILS